MSFRPAAAATFSLSASTRPPSSATSFAVSWASLNAFSDAGRNGVKTLPFLSMKMK